MLHIDDDFDLPNTYKAFTIPLWVDGNDCNKIKLIMFTPEIKVPRSTKEAKQQAMQDMLKDEDFEYSYLHYQTAIKQASKFDYQYLQIN